MLKLPPAPNDAEPDRREILPLLPIADVPELKLSIPLTPLVPLLNVLMLKVPLDDTVPWPETIDKEPPVVVVLCPLESIIRPPTPSDPLSTIILIDPPAPFTPDPEVNIIDPALPLLAHPDKSESEPEMPLFPPLFV
jgi:hypothetical protein